MYNKLEASTINLEPIEKILAVLNARGDLSMNGNKISLDGKFSTRYRFDRLKNRVGSFNVEMPSGKPFNFIKSFYFSDLNDKEAISETYKWFKGYYGLDDDFKGELKMNAKLMLEIKKNAEANRIKQEKIEKGILLRRKTFSTKFNMLKKYYSDGVINYFEGRGISKETLEYNNARTGIVLHNSKTYKNRVFFPMEVGNNVVGIKMRDLYAKQAEYKSMNIPDSGSGLLYNKEAIINTDTMYFCEGEIDKMSLDEAGIKNNAGNMMGANTFSEKWIEEFKHIKNLNILYDFDKNSLAGLKGVLKIMKIMPDKNIKFLDLPKYLNSIYPEHREELLEDFSDINDLWTTHLVTDKPKEDFVKALNDNLVIKSTEDVEKIIEGFVKIHKEDEENDIGSFTLSFKSKIKSLNDLKPMQL